MRAPSILLGLSALLCPLVLAACAFDSATDPTCWGDYDLSTNYYLEGPDTGVVREYWFDIQNGTASPDGFERMVITVNGSLPGPTIYADWGDTVVVHVSNSLENNGTSIHFHGIRQNWTTAEDGVPSITQCPIAPGDSLTQTWKASQYGTTWYHSHFSLQAWNGVFGGIVINGPASAPYDEDKGVIILTDWYHETADSLYVAASSGGPPTADNGLINGTNIGTDGGEYFQTTVTSGSSYRYRIVNTAMDTMFRFMVDNHTMTVIASDLVPIVPYETEYINIGIGQRYDVIINADQDPGNYWMRSIPQTSCSATNTMALNITGIFNYDGVTVALPNTAKWQYNDTCDDETQLVPYLSLDAGSDAVQDTFDIGLSTNAENLFIWTMNDEPFLTNWSYPTLQQVLNNDTVFAAEEQVVRINETASWTYFILESTVGLAHPIHLHGHDFWVLGAGAGTYADSGATLNLANPPRRDVAMLPAAGYLVIAFEADNPGVWLMHCHIGWHTSQGLALQLVELESKIAGTVDKTVSDQTCANWRAYANADQIVQIDSGI